MSCPSEVISDPLQQNQPFLFVEKYLNSWKGVQNSEFISCKMIHHLSHFTYQKFILLFIILLFSIETCLLTYKSHSHMVFWWLVTGVVLEGHRYMLVSLFYRFFFVWLKIWNLYFIRNVATFLDYISHCIWPINKFPVSRITWAQSIHLAWAHHPYYRQECSSSELYSEEDCIHQSTFHHILQKYVSWY